MKKLNIDFIRSEFEKEGYQLLTTKYKNNTQKLDYICPKGHVGTVKWNSWYQGYRCLECTGHKKKDINFIREEFEKEGYQLLTTEYKNSKQKLDYICPKGHVGTVKWSDWSQGKRCLECTGHKKKDINFIKQEFEKEGYQLLTSVYKNSNQRLEYICPKGHFGTVRWSGWFQRKRCAKCYYLRNSGRGNSNWKNYTKEEIKQFDTYRANVAQLTNQNFCKYYYYINPKRLYRSYRQYHLDHIFSIKDGFDNSISPEVVASTINLQMLPAIENYSKGGRSDMTKEMLYILYYQFEKEIKEYEGSV